MAAKSSSIELQVKVGVLEKLVEQLTARIVYLERTVMSGGVMTGDTNPKIDGFDDSISPEEFNMLMGGVPNGFKKQEGDKQ